MIGLPQHVDLVHQQHFPLFAVGDIILAIEFLELLVLFLDLLGEIFGFLAACLVLFLDFGQLLLGLIKLGFLLFPLLQFPPQLHLAFFQLLYLPF